MAESSVKRKYDQLSQTDKMFDFAPPSSFRDYKKQKVLGSDLVVYKMPIEDAPLSTELVITSQQSVTIALSACF